MKKPTSATKNIHVFSKTFLLILAFLQAVSAEASVYLCQDLFLDLPSVAYLERDEQSHAFEIVKKKLIARSEQTKQKLKTLHGAPANYDVVIVGSGPHGSVSAALLSSLAPHLKVLDISNDVPGSVFNNIGDAIWINSPELASGVSSNVLPGTNLGLRHIGEVTNFKMASDLGNYIASTLESSTSDLLIGAKVEKMTVKADNKTEELILSNGHTINARYVIMATGLGSPRWGIKNAKEILMLKMVIEREAKIEQWQPRSVEFFDDTMKRLNSAIHKNPGMQVTYGYKNSDVLIIGDGDSGNVVAEALTGRGPGKLYGLSSNGSVGQVQEAFKVGKEHGVKSLTIAGMKAHDPESFKQYNKRRYDSTVANQIGSDIMGAPKVVSMVPEVSNGKMKVAVVFEGGEARVYDHVIIAAGYENNVFNLLGGTPDSRVPIYGKIDGRETVVATGLTDRKTVGIVGTAAGNISSEADLDASITKNGASINILAGKTKAFILGLIKDLSGNN